MSDEKDISEMTAEEINNLRLKRYLEAEAKALLAQNYADGRVTLQRASLRNIRGGIDDISSAAGNGKGVKPSFRCAVLED